MSNLLSKMNYVNALEKHQSENLSFRLGPFPNLTHFRTEPLTLDQMIIKLLLSYNVIILDVK